MHSQQFRLTQRTKPGIDNLDNYLENAPFSKADAVGRGLSPPSHQRGHHSQAGCASATRHAWRTTKKPASLQAFMCGAETDGRLLVVRARFSRDWNLVDFLVCLIGYLQIIQLPMAFDGIESRNYKVAAVFTKTLAQDDHLIKPFDSRAWQNMFRVATSTISHVHLLHSQQRVHYTTNNPIVIRSKA